MPTISINIDANQHEQLKVFAALNQQGVEEFVLHRSLQDLDGTQNASAEENRLRLREFLLPSLQEADKGHLLTCTAEDVKLSARKHLSSLDG